MAENALFGNVQSHARAVDVGEPENRRVDFATGGEKPVVRSSGVFVNPIEINGIHWMRFVDREKLGHPIDLTRTGVDNADTRADFTQRQEKTQLGGRVEFKIPDGVPHAVDVADFSRHVKDALDALHGGTISGQGADVGFDKPDAISEGLEVVEIGTTTGNASIDHNDNSAVTGKPDRQITPDESESTGD